MSWGSPQDRPVVFLHGGGQTQRAWRHAAQTVAERGYQAITVDQRGHGISDWAKDGSYALEDFAADLRFLVGQLPQPPAVVGASLGGLAAMLAVGEAPAAPVAALVLVDIAPRSSAEGRRRITSFMLANQNGFGSLDEAGAAVADYLPHRPRPRSLDGLRSNLREGPDGRLFWHWDPVFLTGERVDGVEDEDRLERAAINIEQPILLVRGQDSDVLGEEHARWFLDRVRDGDYIDVRGAGHMVAGDSNDVFGNAVLDFLSRRVPSEPPPGGLSERHVSS